MILAQPDADTVPDIIAIVQLAHSYAHAISSGSPRDAAEVYAPDGELTTPVIGPIKGREAIEAAITEGTRELEMVYHMVHSPLVQVRGDRADARFEISEWSKRRADGQTLFYLGFYDDELVRLPEGWRFSKRRLVSRSIARADVPIEKVHPLSALRPTFA